MSAAREPFLVEGVGCWCPDTMTLLQLRLLGSRRSRCRCGWFGRGRSVSVGDFPREEVECEACDGMGEDIYAPVDPLEWASSRCTSCWGTGTVMVCANCLDDLDGCSVCQPKRAGAKA